MFFILIQNGVKMGTQNGTPKRNPPNWIIAFFIVKIWGLGDKKSPRMDPQMDPQMDPPNGGILKLQKNNLSFRLHFGLHFENPKSRQNGSQNGTQNGTQNSNYS